MQCERKLLRSVEDISTVNQNVDVHLIDYGDYCRAGICFLDSDSNFCSILEFTLQDSRGIIGCLLPVIESDKLSWKDDSIITVKSTNAALEQNKYHSTCFIGTICPTKYYNYHRWLLSSWHPKNSHFSVFEGQSTNKKFIEESLAYLTFEIPSKTLCLPTLKTYSLHSKAQDLASLEIEEQNIIMFYSSLQDIKDYEDVISLMSDMSLMYKHEPKFGSPIYWRHENVIIKPLYQKLATPPKGYTIDTLPVNTPAMASEFIQSNNLRDTKPITPIVTPLTPIDTSGNASRALIIVILIFFIIIAFALVVVVIYYLDIPQVVVATPNPTLVITS